MKKIHLTVFDSTLTKMQKIAGLIYLPLHIFIIPIFVNMLAYYLPGGLSQFGANCIYYGAGLLFCFSFMWKFLRNAYDILLDALMPNIMTILMSYFLNMVLSFLAASVMLLIFGDGIANPNNAAVMDMADKSQRATLGLAVFIAPIVEEILFRGVLFGSLRKKSRILAYSVSILLFAACHVWQYALASMDWRVLLYIIQYLPGGFALAWSYEKTNCIWVPIFGHMLLNVVS
ncbi:MAG: type II CAAX endopeptidase family protein, partial [Oscillospiraceae bacterium]